MKQLLLLTLISLGVHFSYAQEENPKIISRDFGNEKLNADFHQGRLVDGSKFFATFDIRDTISKIDQVVITLKFNRISKKKNILLLEKSLVDKFKIKKNEIKVDYAKNTIQITKINMNHPKHVATHFITFYFNQKFTDLSASIILKSDKKTLQSEFIEAKKISSPKK